MDVPMIGPRPISILQRIRNFRRGVLLKWGSAVTKERIWSQEFASGRWICLEKTEGDCLYPIVERYCAGGSILDLGCGSGNTGNELNPASYRQYTGVDISAEAVRQAVERSRLNDRADKNLYLQADIETFVPDRQFRVILFRESIYYVPPSKVHPLLNRYRGFLEKEGAFIVRLYDRRSVEAVVSTIQENFSVVDAYAHTDGKTMILVFR
jgi:SAM-dependent methyltransferase